MALLISSDIHDRFSVPRWLELHGKSIFYIDTAKLYVEWTDGLPITDGLQVSEILSVILTQSDMDGGGNLARESLLRNLRLVADANPSAVLLMLNSAEAIQYSSPRKAAAAVTLLWSMRLLAGVLDEMQQPKRQPGKRTSATYQCHRG